MELLHVMGKMLDCKDKAGISLSFTSVSSDDFCDLIITNNEKIYLKRHGTPYTCDDILDIKYKSNSDEEGGYVKLFFKNGDTIAFYSDVRTVGYINGKEYIGLDLVNLFRDSCPPLYRHFDSAEEVLEEIQDAASNVNLQIKLPSDEDETGDVFFVSDAVHIKENYQTPYKISDIEGIMYDKHRGAHVRIFFSGDDSLTFREDHITYMYYVNGRYVYYDDEKAFEMLRLFSNAKLEGILADEFVVIDETLVRYNGTDEDVYVPSGIKRIAEKVFMDSKLESVTFPEGLKEIGDECFSLCFNLEQITFNDDLESIGSRAFRSSLLNDIQIPHSIKHVGECAFRHYDEEEYDEEDDLLIEDAKDECESDEQNAINCLLVLGYTRQEVKKYPRKWKKAAIKVLEENSPAVFENMRYLQPYFDKEILLKLTALHSYAFNQPPELFKKRFSLLHNHFPDDWAEIIKNQLMANDDVLNNSSYLMFMEAVGYHDDSYVEEAINDILHPEKNCYEFMTFLPRAEIEIDSEQFSGTWVWALEANKYKVASNVKMLMEKGLHGDVIGKIIIHATHLITLSESKIRHNLAATFGDSYVDIMNNLDEKEIIKKLSNYSG